MNDIERIYSLLLHSNGLKIRAISQELELDKYYVAEIMFSSQNIPYWYQDDDSLWYAKEGSLQIEEPEKEIDELIAPVEIPQKFNINRFLEEDLSDSLRSYLSQISKYRIYSNDEMIELFKRYRDGDQKAFDKIIKSQQRMVANIALLYCRKGALLEDIIQEGNVGLVKATERFDYTQYRSFSNYAKSWVLQSISSSMATMPYIVRLPLNQLFLYRKVRKFKEKFEQIHGYNPSVNDIEIGEEIDIERIKYLDNLPYNLNSLTCLSGDLDNKETETNAIDEFLNANESELFVMGLLRRLDNREKQIIKRFYGINTKEEELSSIGDYLGLTRERVRQIKEKTVRHLRDILKNRKWIVDNEFTVQHEEEEQKEVKPIVDLEHKKKIKRKKEGNKKKPIPGILHVPYARQEKTIEKVRTEEVPDTQYEVNEKDGLKVGDSIYYDYQYCTIRNIIENGKFTKLIIEYINGVRDAVIYKKTKVITKRTSPKSHQNYHHKEFENSKCMMIKEAMVGDRIIYDADHCTVIDKKTIKGSLRLIVRYEDGTIDNLRNDWNSYKIVSRNNEDVISTKMDNESSISEIAVNEEREVEEDDIDIPSVEPYREIKVPLQETKDDELEEGSIDIIKFKTIFDNKSTSYKFFWFMSIISLAKEKDCLRITYKDIVIRMAAMAWPIVFEYEIDLGKVDMISKYLNDILKNTTLKKFVSSKLVEDYLSTFYRSKGIDSILKPLLKNVPYRFLSPWIKYTTDEEVIEKSNSDDCACLYALRKNGIVLNEKWWEYIRERYSKICEYTEGSFIMYVQPNNKNKNLTRFISKGWSLV